MDGFPAYPEFSPDLERDCQEAKDPKPLLFEWFKFFGELILDVGSIAPETSGYLVRPPRQKAVVEGLTNRCSRLMFSIGRLTCDGKGGESAAILARCLIETAIVLRWLTESKDSADVFGRYLVAGLKPDIELEDHILSSINQRDGKRTVREQRMLESIQRSRDEAGYTREQVECSKAMPDLKEIMTKALGMGSEQYIGAQRMMSQFVHGRWSDLRAHYISMDGAGAFQKKDIYEVPVHSNVFTVGGIAVANAARSVFGFFVGDGALECEFVDYLGTAIDGLLAADAIRSSGDEDLV